MTEIYGVDAQYYYQLPTVQQETVRQQYLTELPEIGEDPSIVSGDTGSSPILDPAATTTPQEAVAAIQDLPLPDYAEMGPLLHRMPSGEREAFYAPRNQLFNDTRAQLARDALDRMQPQREDYAPAASGHVGELEYREAVQAFSNNAYVRELNRIITEAETSPTRIPPYLESASPTGGARSYSEAEMRGILASVGIEIPQSGNAEAIADGYAILNTMPNDVIAVLANPGTEVSFTAALGAGIPGRAGPTAGVQVEGQVEMEEAKTGPNFEQTQQFRMSVTAQEHSGGEYKPTMVDKLRKWSNHANHVLPDSARNRLDGSDLMKAFRNGSKPFPVNGSYVETSGTRIEFEAGLTPEQAAQVESGELDGLPNPLDPLNMPIGSSTLVRAQQFEGTELEVNFKALTFGSTQTNLSGVGYGVKRLDASMVEVYAGPIDTVESQAFLGLGRQGAAAIGVSVGEQRETQEMKIARIDLSTSEGQAAYQEFISTGKIPEWTPPGVPQSGTTTVYNAEDSLSLRAEIGSLGGSLNSENDTSIVETRWQDGSGELISSTGSPGGNYAFTTTPIDSSGRYVEDATTWQHILTGVSDGDAIFYQDAYGVTDVAEGEQHLKLTYTASDLMQLRDQAREYLDKREFGPSYQELKDGEASTNREILANISLAETPQEVFAILSGSPTGQYGFYGFGVELRSMTGLLDHLGALPGGSAPGTLDYVEAG